MVWNKPPKGSCPGPKPFSLSKGPVAAAQEEEGAPGDAPPGPLRSPLGTGVPRTLFSTWDGWQDTTASKTAPGDTATGTPCSEGPPKPTPALPDPTGAISSPHGGHGEQDQQQRSWEGNQHDGSASLLWVAQPGLLFQGDKQSSCHPLVSTSGQESIRGATLCYLPLWWPVQLSRLAPSRSSQELFGGFFFSLFCSHC